MFKIESVGIVEENLEQYAEYGLMCGSKFLSIREQWETRRESGPMCGFYMTFEGEFLTGNDFDSSGNLCGSKKISKD